MHVGKEYRPGQPTRTAQADLADTVFAFSQFLAFEMVVLPYDSFVC